MELRAARVEGRQNLRFIHALQTAYFDENGEYGKMNQMGYVFSDTFGSISEFCGVGSINEIGFKVPDPCKLKYVYSTEGGQDEFNGIRFSSPSLRPKHLYSARASLGAQNLFGGEIATIGNHSITIRDCLGVSDDPSSELFFSDILVINQDGDLGFRNQNAADGLNGDLSNAIKICGF